MHDHPGDCPYDVEDEVICLGEFGDVEETTEEPVAKDGKLSWITSGLEWTLAILIMVCFALDLYDAMVQSS